MDVPRNHSASSSSSSAIDLTGTGTPTTLTFGALSSGPSSPALDPPPRSSFARRRTSWNRGDVVQDPLRSDFASLNDSGPSYSGTNMADHRMVNNSHDDPFRLTSTDEPRGYAIPDLPFDASANRRYRTTYSTAQPGASQASLIAPSYLTTDTDVDENKFDDNVRLTRNITPTSSIPWDGEHMLDAGDPERTARSRRRSKAYGTPSPLKKTGTTLQTVSRNLRRMSLRVVNLASTGLEGHGRGIRLPDDNDERDKDDSEDDVKDGMEEEEDEVLPDLSHRLPIRGRTLCFLEQTNAVRLAMFRLLIYPWTEPIILLLILANTVVLTIQASRTETLPDSNGTSLPPHVKGYFHQWEDYALFVLFVLFTLEAFARICVSGLILDPEVPLSSVFKSLLSPIPVDLNTSVSHSAPPSQPQRSLSLGERIRVFHMNITRPFTLSHNPSLPKHSRPPPIHANSGDSMRSIVPLHIVPPAVEKATSKLAHLRTPSQPTYGSRVLRSDQTEQLALPFRLALATGYEKTQQNVPYLRHSWTRIDFVAIVSFWIAFALATGGLEHGAHHIGVFRAMSVLRTARLLAVTSGTTTIMQSLKKARPLLTNVAYFVVFAMVLFSIISVQAFNGSFRRSCYISPTLGEGPVQVQNQLCGGYIDPVTLNVTGFIPLSGNVTEPKGYICPLGEMCMEEENPYSNIENFDTIYYAALQVVIVASSNGWSPIMYAMIDSEFFVSCFFFIVCIVVLNFWLINLFVAVITNTFSAIRSSTKKSAFGAAPLGRIVDEQDEGWAASGTHVSKTNRIKEVYQSIRWCWVALALASLVLQATRTVEPGPIHLAILDKGELGLTLVFDLEIIVRVLAHLPDWRSFFSHGNNWLDTILAIGSSVIQIPLIHNSAAYPWLTVFQLARFYRVILEVPRMRPLLLAVFGNLYGLANMSLFLILINFISALVAVQLFRGDVGEDQTMNFGQIFTSFLAMYQITSSENWTNVLYAVTQAEIPLGQAVLTAIFISMWFLFANFIVLQLFIAVINENFSVAEETKKGQQATNYWATQQPIKRSAGWLRRFNPYRWMKANPKAIVVENLPSNLVLPMQKTLVETYGISKQDTASTMSEHNSTTKRGPGHYSTKSLKMLQSLFTGETPSDDVPLTTLRNVRRDTVISRDPSEDDETERHLEILASMNVDAAAVENINEELYERRMQKADFIRAHPSFDKTFWLFSQKNYLRQLCQRLVRPAHGDRIFGLPPSPIAHPMFQLVLLLAVIGGIVVEAIATPVYRRNYVVQYGPTRGAWFEIAETAFGLTLLVEFLIKIVADGFILTPNAYLRSIWNILDLFILSGLLVNLITALIFVGGLSRLTRSLKALRALRLITLIEKMRLTFSSLIFSGAIRILDAAMLAILYMIPYAVWGLNIFRGLMKECNDSSVTGLSECIDEFSTNVYGDSFGFLTPRVWSDPSPSTTFSFDTFQASLLILFEIVSLEGWVDVMSVATSITGENLQPQTNASQVNAIFFLIYNLLGAVVILTLFVSIIIANFSSKTGVSLLTQPQREWIDLQKLIMRQRPSRRPKNKPVQPLRAWCFERAVNKHGWWSRMMTSLFILHVFALMTQTITQSGLFVTLRDDFFLLITIAYVIDILIRLYGLGWASFSANGWNNFDVIIASGSLVTTVVLRLGAHGFAFDQFQKLFLVSIAFKLVQRTNSLNQLFKTAVSSLPAIVSLLALWLILFIFFAILYLEVFSLTKWNTAETRTQNYSSLSSALVMLAFMSTGEGWNQYMHDFALMYPRCTNPSLDQPDTDCGSTGWAYTLFIAWNLLSMYIFVNMFTGVVVESFSYVFQTTGGAKSITREEMRAFKKTWAEFANPRTGHLEKSYFVPFFAKLSGVFEVKIYPTEYRVPNILTATREIGNPERSWRSKVIDNIDIYKLDRILSGVDYGAIRKRRNLYSRLYHEAAVTHEPGKGMSFTNMLLLLAHNKLIDDREALVLKDLVVRTETNKLVTDLVNLDRVRSLLRMIYHRRRFLVLKAERARQQRLEQQGIPAIVVEADGPMTTPPVSSRDITAYYDSPSLSPKHDRSSPRNSFVLDDDSPRNSFALRRNRPTSDVSMLSTEFRTSREGSPLRDSYGADEDTQVVLASMQSSVWGEMMMEAANADEEM